MSIIGHAVSFAPREIVLDYYSPTTRHSWSKLIERALQENGWKVMEMYLEQVRCEPASIKSRPEIRTVEITVTDDDKHQVAQRRPLVLGIDIGGGSIKIRLYELTKDREGNLCWNLRKKDSPLNVTWEDLEKPHLAEGTKNDWASSIDNGIRDVSTLIKYLIDRAGKHFGSLADCKAAGIAIAAPVSGGVPSAISGVLGNLQGFTDRIVDGNPVKIHQLDFAAALEREKDWAVVCLNDGEADIRDSDETVSAGAEGVSLVFKEGTGVAFAVYVDGRLLGIPGETAKAIVNLFCKPQPRPLNQRFQNGVVGKYCSQKAFETLLPNDIWNSIGGGEGRGTWLGSRLEAALNPVATVQAAQGDSSVAAAEGQSPAEGGTVTKLTKFLLGVVDLSEFFRECAKIEQDRQVAVTIRALEGDLKMGQGHEIAKCLARHEPDFPNLSAEQKFAVGCAWVLGRWLADAIALAVDLYGAGEVRLAGGPLGGKTGIFVTKSAERALLEVYGFDVVAVPYRDLRVKHESGQGSGAVHRHREIRPLNLAYPPEDPSESGPRGAAKAALDGYIRSLKGLQMRECRDGVVEQRAQQAFSARDVCQAGQQKRTSAQDPWLLTDTEVEAMLSRESSSLGLTRLQDGRFTKYG